MAQLKDTIVSGNLRVTDTTLTDTLQVTKIKAPTTSGGTTYGPGTSGQVLKSNGTTTYWASDSNTDEKVNVILATTSKAYLLGTTTTPTGTAAGVTSVADTGVYLGTTAGSLYATSFYENGTSLASKYAAIGHKHTTTIAADSGTNQLTLAASTKYKLTAGETNFIFTTPPNTTYSANNGVGLSGTTFYNSGVRAVSIGSANGTISVNTNGSTDDVAVKGLDSAAYTKSTSYVQTHVGENFDVAKSGYFAVMANENSANPNSLLPTQNQWWHILSMSWNTYGSTDNSDVKNWVSQLAIPTYENKSIGMKWRTNSSAGSTLTRADWVTVLDEKNYTSYTYSATTSRTANTVLAAPNESDGTASFRKLVAADIPSLNYSKVSISRNLTSGTKVGTITIDGTATDLYCQTNTNTTYSAGTGLSLSGTTFNHSNSVTAVTIYNKPYVRYDAQGHITGSSYWTATAAGTNDESGWIKVATMVHTDIHDDTPIMLLVSQRGNTITYKLHIVWKNTSNTDPDINKFQLSSDIDTNADAYIKKSATSTWELYIKKLDNWDAIAMHLYVGKYFPDHMTWTWQDVQTTESAITGGIEAEKIVPYNYYQSRTANTVLVAPNGSAGAATFRKLVAADLPDSYLPTSGGTVSGTLVLSKTQDASGTANNSPALIVGGAATSTHLELDANEIMAKTNGTSTAALYINNDGGNVYINNNLAARHTATPTSGQVVITDGTGGGIKSSGYTIAKSVPSNAKFTDENVKQTPTTSSNTSYRPVLVGMDYGDPGYTATEKTDAVYTVPRVMIKPSTGDLVLYSGGDADSPSLTFQRGTQSDGTYDWKLYVTGGHLNFNRNNAGTWTNLVQFEKTGKLYVSGTIYSNNTPVSLDGHKHGLLHSDLNQASTNGTTGGWSVIGIDPAVTGYVLKSIRVNTTSPDWLSGDYGAGIAFGGSDTKGVISMSYQSPPVITFAGGNHNSSKTAPVWYFKISGTSGSTYNLANFNAATATKLETARNINGVSFDGSANITIPRSIKHIHTANGTDGSGGWVKIARITVTEAYADQPMTFTIAQRRIMQYRIHLLFTNSGSAAATEISQFIITRDNSWTDTNNDPRAYIIKPSDGIFDLYIRKTVSWDRIFVVDFTKADDGGGINYSVTWTNVHVDDSAITGGTEAVKKLYLPTTTNYAGSSSAGGAATNVATSVATTAGARPVFYAYLGDNTRVVYNTNFTYNPSGNVLTATTFTGNTFKAGKASTIDGEMLFYNSGGSGVTTLKASAKSTSGTYLLPERGNLQYTLSCGHEDLSAATGSLSAANVVVPSYTKFIKIVFKSDSNPILYSMVEIPYFGNGDYSALVQVGTYGDGQQGGSPRIVMKAVIINITDGTQTGKKSFTVTASPTTKINGSSISNFERNITIHKIYATD